MLQCLRMTTAMLEKRIVSLEKEVREMRVLIEPIVHVATVPKKNTKKLPVWLRASLKDVEEGRVSGPFHSVDELMRDLES